METGILYGIVILFVFIFGLGIGLLIPYYIGKYVEKITKPTDTSEKKEEIKKPESFTREILEEWLYGEGGAK